MPNASTPQGRLFGVLDIETAPDPLALTLSRHRSGSRVPTAMHRLTAASMLTAREEPDGTWRALRLATVGGEHASERTMLIEVDGFLDDLVGGGGTCVTFNGLNHDLPTLRRRAARHLLFRTPGIHPEAPIPHHDLFRRCSRGWRDEWPSLKAACAGLGIPVNHSLSDPRGPGEHATRRKCETDVACTFLLLLYELAIARRDAAPVREGWKAFAAMLERRHRAPHLLQFARAIPDFGPDGT